MKVSLVVASGVHQGKVIPIAGPQFVIGRDEGCQLRPASPAISKRHCAIRVRDGKVFVEDFGSTNGTFVDDQPVSAEQEVAAGARVKVGPLDFTLKVDGAAPPVRPSDRTPLPDALKAVAETAGAPKLTPAAQPAAVKLTATPAKPQPAAPKSAAKPKGGDDDIAAMLLGMDDDDPNPSDVPGGSTVMEMAPVDLAKLADAQKATPQTHKQQQQAAAAQSSKDAASELLRKYMRRPK
jgi:predicted component of type VI protein secretion system